MSIELPSFLKNLQNNMIKLKRARLKNIITRLIPPLIDIIADYYGSQSDSLKLYGHYSLDFVNMHTYMEEYGNYMGYVYMHQVCQKLIIDAIENKYTISYFDSIIENNMYSEGVINQFIVKIIETDDRSKAALLDGETIILSVSAIDSNTIEIITI